MTKKELCTIGVGYLVLSLGVYGYSYSVEENYKNTIDNLNEMVYNKEVENKELTLKLEMANAECTYLEDKLRTLEAVEIASPNIVVLEATAYTHSGELTASGVYPTVGRTVASNDFPLGTVLVINGHEYVVEDTGGMGHGVVDIFMDSEEECEAWGRRNVEVEVK